jgi:RHS repeat-associated protein
MKKELTWREHIERCLQLKESKKAYCEKNNFSISLVDSKISEVRLVSSSGKDNLKFEYDAMGNRVAKYVMEGQSPFAKHVTYYVRDASGNVVAVYEHDLETPESYHLAERHIYGSSRVGMITEKVEFEYVYGNQPSEELIATLSFEETVNFELEYTIGKKQYELSNHLGNVLAVISDWKVPVISGASVVSYTSIVISSQDYSPFGVTLSGRSWSEGYRYGFNGKEKDPEGMGGGGNTYDYGFRIYNTNLAKFLSVDPLFKSYPWYTPYQFAGNDPIRNIDIDGLEGGSAIEYMFTGIGQQIEAWWNSWSLFPSSAPNKPAPPINNNSQQPVLKKSDAATVANQAQSSSNAASKKDINLSEDVPFVSQFSLSNPNVACCRACQKILKDFGISAAGSKSNRIITGRDNSDHTAIEATKNAKAGVDYINQQLESGNPVMVGVNHTLGKGQSDGESADHFVVITGRSYDEDKKQYYFNFYEVGTKDEGKGTSDSNRLYVNDNNTITGTNYAGKRQFTVTDVRKN